MAAAARGQNRCRRTAGAWKGETFTRVDRNPKKTGSAVRDGAPRGATHRPGRAGDFNPRHAETSVRPGLRIAVVGERRCVARDGGPDGLVPRRRCICDRTDGGADSVPPNAARGPGAPTAPATALANCACTPACSKCAGAGRTPTLNKRARPGQAVGGRPRPPRPCLCARDGAEDNDEMFAAIAIAELLPSVIDTLKAAPNIASA
jgi:hypothetical protein